MNLMNFAVPALALSLALGLSPSYARAQSESPAPRGQQPPQKTEVFVGKIIKAQNGQYALLTDEQGGKGAYLDDQEKARPFEGKNVKVTGVFDLAQHVIRVSNIELA
jgi:hypothetical protein